MSSMADPTLATAMATSTNRQKIDVLFRFMQLKGQAYYDEEITQLEHALQCAHRARLATTSPTAIIAALLHDLGHFLVDEHNINQDLLHEQLGADFLDPLFPSAVTEPIKLHVPAKRYLCTTDARYFDTLSESSKQSFRLQGSFMSDTEKAHFEANSYYKSAVQLRLWDDLAKVKDQETDDLASYCELAESSLK